MPRYCWNWHECNKPPGCFGERVKVGFGKVAMRDAEGKEYSRVEWVDTETGMMSRFLVRDGKTVVGHDDELMRIREAVPVPVTVEFGGKGD